MWMSTKVSLVKFLCLSLPDPIGASTLLLAPIRLRIWCLLRTAEALLLGNGSGQGLQKLLVSIIPAFLFFSSWPARR